MKLTKQHHDKAAASLEPEVITIEAIVSRVSFPVLVDVPDEIISLLNENLFIIPPNPLSLSCNTVSKGEILHVGLLSLDLNLSIVHFFPHSILLPLQVLFRFHSHADLCKLKANFEQGEEWDHVSSPDRISDFTKNISFDLILGHTDSPGDGLEPSLLKNGWVGFFAG